MLNRKLFFLTGCLFLLGIGVRAQAPVAQFTSNVTSGCAPLGVKFADQSTNSPTSWEWGFSNGQTSNLQNPVISFGTPGTYTVTLIVKNASGADAIRDTNYITVYASPTVSFGLNGQNLACAPVNIQFANYSQPGQGTITSYLWKFGDGATSDDPTPSHLYTQTGYYNVGLTVTNSGGCSNSSTYIRVLRVVEGVQPNFTWSQTSTSCTAPYLLNFINQTAGPGTLTYTWSLGSSGTPATSTATNPTGISYPAAGNYSVLLTAQSSLGCSDTLTQTVPISSNTPVITAPAAGCLNTPISFSNATTPAPLSSSWTFGDGGASNQATATHSYTTPGTYPVTLTNTYASCTSTSTSSITIGASLVPVFTATPTSSCQSPLTVQFTDQTTPTPTQWLWKFGDGGTSTQPNPSYTYTTTGNFNVSLTTTSAAGCSGTTTQTQEVNIVPPTITMSGVAGCIGVPITPAYKVTAIDGVASYSWSAPGATPSTSNSAAPGFVYATPGFYPVTLTITTTGGCTVTQTYSGILRAGTPTIAAFTESPNPVCGTAIVTFNSSSIPADQWYWNFGDGAAIDSGQAPTHQFLKFGTETVTLSVAHDGCITQTTNNVTVNPPIPNFGYVVNCAANNPLVNNNLNVSFLDSSLINTTLTPISYTWFYGDGMNSGAIFAAPYLPPSHNYAAPGLYNITLQVTNGTCMATATKQLTLQNIDASFTTSMNPVCIQQPFILTSTSNTSPTGAQNAGYIWAFGPGDSVNQASPYTTHLSTPGTYATTLIVVDQNGCRYTSPPTNIIITAPTVKFTAPPGGCDDSTITFTDNSTPSALGTTITNYIWNFGDGMQNSFAGPPFTHQYADTGSYTVIETAVDNAGCGARDTLVAAVQITAPHASFIEPDSFYCPNTPATFTDQSQGYGLTYSWNFGDGSGNGASTAQNPQHPFPATTGVTYPVTLTITDKYGCTTDTSENIKIESPIAAFTIADTTAICFPLQTLFTAAGQYYDSLYWEFGDGSTSTLPVTSHFYNTLDTFTATLVVQGPGGCQDSAKRRVLVLNPNTTSTFTFTPKTACDSVVANFAIIPPGYTSFTLQFGDGQADSSQNEAPVHTYRSPNTFVPLVYLTDATGCIVTLYDTALTVLGAVPFFTVSQSAFCDSGTVNFIDYTITNNGVLNKTLYFGDGNDSAQQPPLTVPFNTSHYYNTPGNPPATLTVITDNNCVASYTDTIKVYQTPHPIISDSGNLCAGIVQFLGKLVSPDADTVFWTWNFGNGQTANVQNPLVNAGPGSYSVSLIASVSIGCSDTTSGTVIVNPNPVIKGPAEITTPVGVPVTIPFTYSNGITTYTWTPAANLSCTDCANPSATLTFNQTYTVMATDSNNCSDTASILIKTICNDGNYFLPNTFSPNGDGVNDYFYPRGTGIYNIQSMSVFNRWGQQVFQRKNFAANSETMGWDGTFNGHPAPSDAYVYIVEVICNNAQVVALHGNVVLVR